MAEFIIPLLFVIFSIGLLSLCVRCLLALSARSQTFGMIMIDPHGTNAESGPRSRQRGMDSETISAFPIIAYSDIKVMEAGKGLVECAVCLSDFGDGDCVRLLPKCDHAFHPECIDKWLSKHITCPICRTNLVPDDEKLVESSEMNYTGTFAAQSNHVLVNIDEADERGTNRLLSMDGQAMSVCGSHNNNNRV